MALRRRRGHCAMCSYRSDQEQALLDHTLRCHRFDPTFVVHCGEEGCGVWNSYKSHMRRKHGRDDAVFRGEAMKAGDDDDDADMAIRPGDIQKDAVIADGAYVPQAVIPVMPPVLEIQPDEEILMWQAAKFLLGLRENSNLSQSATTKVAEGVEDLLINRCSLLKSQVLGGADADGHVPVDHVLEAFKDIEERGLFAGVNSRHLLDSFLIRKGNLILPHKITLETLLVWKRKPKLKLVEEEVSFYNISLKDSLTQLLNQEEILECVKNPRPFRENGYLNTFSDGVYVKDHPLFGKFPDALMIIAYFDDIEICNPLGSKSKIHKLSMFYWTLGNVYPEHRSALRSINLFAIAKTAHLRKFGASKILAPFVEEIKMLESENGMAINIKGVVQNFRGSILFFTGDTLASNYVAGFKESPGFALHPCRACMGSSVSIKKSFCEKDFTPRSKAMYDEQCKDLEVVELTKEARMFWSKSHGINERSILYSLQYFDIITCMVQDLMHVVIEGCLEMECRNLIKYYVNEKMFTLQDLNDKLKSFNYGHTQKDKPSPIDLHHLDSKLRQNCAQTLTLAISVPFLIIDRIPVDDARLMNFVLLLQIVNLMLAFRFKPEDVVMLKSMIDVHHLQFSNLYPNVSITPKFHFMIHMPQQILNFGPLRQQWCMRFEAAHCRIKNLASVLKIFKNIAFSMAYRYQALRCAQLLTLPGAPSINFLYTGDSVSSGESIKIGDHTLSEMCMAALNIVNPDKKVLLPKQVQSLGTIYRRKYSILLCDQEEGLPEFGIIQDIVVDDREILFIYKVMKTVIFEQRLNAYEVEVGDTNGCILLRDLIHPHNISFHTLANGLSFVILLNHRRTEYY